MYSDSAIIYFMVDGVTVQSNKITASSYQAFVSGTTLTTPPHSVTNIRFYPTGKYGATGPTGPAGSGIIQSDYVVLGCLSADQSITSGVDTTVEFVDQYDPQGWYDAGTYRFQPTIAGYYLITYQAWWGAAADTNQFNIQITDQSGNQLAINQIPTDTVTGSSHTIARIHYMNGSGDYVYFTAFNGSSGTVDIQRGGTAYGAAGTFFSAFLIPAGGVTGPTGMTGPAGPDTYTTADAAWWDTSAPTTMTNAIDRLAYAFYTANGAIPVLP
jgi:hypothetical protein